MATVNEINESTKRTLARVMVRNRLGSHVSRVALVQQSLSPSHNQCDVSQLDVCRLFRRVWRGIIFASECAVGSSFSLTPNRRTTDGPRRDPICPLLWRVWPSGDGHYRLDEYMLAVALYCRKLQPGNLKNQQNE